MEAGTCSLGNSGEPATPHGVSITVPEVPPPGTSRIAYFKRLLFGGRAQSQETGLGPVEGMMGSTDLRASPNKSEQAIAIDRIKMFYQNRLAMEPLEANEGPMAGPAANEVPASAVASPPTLTRHSCDSARDMEPASGAPVAVMATASMDMWEECLFAGSDSGDATARSTFTVVTNSVCEPRDHPLDLLSDNMSDVSAQIVLGRADDADAGDFLAESSVAGGPSASVCSGEESGLFNFKL
ncbi:hypothetical protein CYMTET_7285 [Cymbomonas tetramitiformis]|uniref:Uncharacterized protein n=1 Tax=Cymbomonas tetramitiformis TaxID=36881 RepID=A0AAE0LHL9_9CHLO|nr:hypothetical protein CYMTET_7285 [Cymbomonas tetramitiformis]